MDDQFSNVGLWVTSSRRIEQSPLDDAPPVPRGTEGTVEDWWADDGLYAVDFEGDYGVVLCLPEEITRRTP